MPLRTSAAKSAPGRDSSVTRFSSSQHSSRGGVTSNMGRRCAHDGCNRLTLTGGPKCHSHTPRPQASPPIRGSAQIRGTDSLILANSQVKKDSTSPGRLDTLSPAGAVNWPSRRSGESQHPPHPVKSLGHKSLPAKATARKSIAKPSQRREDSNSAAGDESEIVVASDSNASTDKPKASKRAQENVLDSPRKKQRLGLSNVAVESEESRPLTNGATHEVPAKKPESSTSRPSPQPATATTTAAVSSASLAAAPKNERDEQSRSESRGKEPSPPTTHISLDASLHGDPIEGEAKKKMLRNTSVAEHAPEKPKAGSTTSSNFHTKERTAEREKSNGVSHTKKQSLKKPEQDMTSASTVEPTKGEKNKDHPVVLSLPKSSLGYDPGSALRSAESTWQSTILAPEPDVKKPQWTSFVGGQIGHKSTAQSQAAYSSYAPLGIQPGLKGLVPGPAVEATQHALSTIVPNNAGETRNSQPAVIPNPTAKLQTVGSQPIALSATETKYRAEKAKSKTLGVETAAGQVSPPAPQSTGMSSRPGVFIDASSSTDRLKFWDIVDETTRPVLRASSFTDKETLPVPRDVASSARNQSASSQLIQNEYGQHLPAAPRQPIFSDHSMHTTPTLNHVFEDTKSGVKALFAIENFRGSQGHQSSSTYSQRKEVASKLQSGYSEHSSALPQRTKGQSLFSREVVAPPKTNRTTDQAGNLPEKTELPTTNGVASTAKVDTTRTQLRKEGNSNIKTGQSLRNSPMVIDLVSSDSDTPAPSKTIPKTKPLINEARRVWPLQMPSVTIGPISTLTGVLPKPGASADGLGESQQVWGKPLATGEPISTRPEGKTQIYQRPSISELVATMSGDKTTDSDKPLLTPSRRWTNVTPKRWKALNLSQRKQMLQDRHDESKFDEFIYGPANASNHPRPSSRGKASVEGSRTPKTAPPTNFRHFDPRVHWTHARPKEWHERKQKEIADRGNRKAPQNFGRAAARRGRLKASVRPRKIDLPERVERNPKWMAALAELDDMAKSYHAAQRAKARLRKKRQEAAKDREGDTEMRDAPPENPGSAIEAPLIGGMRRPHLEVMMRGRWREMPIG